MTITIHSDGWVKMPIKTWDKKIAQAKEQERLRIARWLQEKSVEKWNLAKWFYSIHDCGNESIAEYERKILEDVANDLVLSIISYPER